MLSNAIRPRRLLILLFALVATLAQSGCVVIPTSATGTFEEEKVLADALIGTRVEDIRLQLGKPNHAFETPDISYLIYRRDAEEKWLSLAHPVAIIWYQLPVQWGSAKLIQCLLIETRNDEVVRAEVKSLGHKLDSAMHLPPSDDNENLCPSLFWKKKELKRIEIAAKNHRPTVLEPRAAKGDADAAIELAREYGQLQYVRKLAVKGHRDALIYLALEDDNSDPLRNLAAAGDVEAAKILAERFENTGMLYELAYQGNVEAALILARIYGDSAPLQALKDTGNTEAAVNYTTFSCRRVYYNLPGSSNVHFSDEYVNTCKGDELWDKKIVLHDVWIPARNRKEMRWYFRTIPKAFERRPR